MNLPEKLTVEIPEEMLAWQKEFRRDDLWRADVPKRIAIFDIDRTRCRARSILAPYLKKKLPEGADDNNVMNLLMASMVSEHFGPVHRGATTTIDNFSLGSDEEEDVLPPPQAFLKKVPKAIYSEAILSVGRSFMDISGYIMSHEDDVMYLSYTPGIGKMSVTRAVDYRIARYMEFMKLINSEIEWND